MIQVLFQFGRGFGCGYIEIELFSDFLDVNRVRDFVETIGEIVNRAESCGFRCFRSTGADQMALETT